MDFADGRWTELLASLGLKVGAWPRGLDTPLRELGHSDREMLALARTLAGPASLYLLDMPPARSVPALLQLNGAVRALLATV